ncbi:pyrroline-5-carboxylate reductase [Brevibacterium ihuae]|uniref:pyrroline-5-carboxylate reductase n=1 Tax=Brevibacterium ihuae TaxID=1631743 RepID=UPI000C792506|nr:pyrroline-5-carboxylate reductase [Brevibacterium ihuae]
MTIASIGTGSMGGALLAGVLRGGADPESVIATTGSRASADGLRERLGVRTASVEEDTEANRTAVADAEFVLLGVKPWAMKDTLAEIAGSLRPDAVLVSMAAGVSIAQLTEWSGSSRIIRIMPNTPSAVGHGVIALAATADVPQESVAEVAGLLAGAGDVVEMTEDELQTMIGLSGSGVAYFFLLAEKLVEAGVAQGMGEEMARRIVVGTAAGAGRLLEETPDPAGLRTAVTSKGGTTHAAMTSFEGDDFGAIVERAARAASARAREMESGG